MKPNRHTTQRTAVTSLAGAVIAAMLLWLGSATPARAIPQLSLVGGTGAPGGTVAVTVALADDTGNVGVSSDQRIAFPTDKLEFFQPVATNCTIAQRLADTHEVAGRIMSAGLLDLTVAVKGTPPPPLPPLGDGDLATCNFHILAGAPTGTAALMLEDPCLGDTNGQCVPVNTVDGSVTITNVTPTFTPTSTPTIGMHTPTGTPTGTTAVTFTPTATQTATNTSGTPPSTHTPTNTVGGTNTPTATPTTGTPKATSTATTGAPRPADSDDCSIVPVERSSSSRSLVLLLVPALLVWARRRRF
jgi:hypothetical protein